MLIALRAPMHEPPTPAALAGAMQRMLAGFANQTQEQLRLGGADGPAADSYDAAEPGGAARPLGAPRVRMFTRDPDGGFRRVPPPSPSPY